MVPEPLIAEMTARSGASERGRIMLDSCCGESRVGCGKLRRALYLVFAFLAYVLQRVRSSMTEPTVQDLLHRIAQMEEHMNTAGQATRDAGSRAQAAQNRARAAQTAARAAGARQGTGSTALVDTGLLGEPRTISGALADWKS